MNFRIRNILKKIVYAIITQLASLRKAKPTASPVEMPRRVLVVNLGLIGDALLATASIDVLRQLVGSDVAVDFLTTPYAELTVRSNPNVNKVFLYNAFWADPAHSHLPRLSHIKKTMEFLRIMRSKEYDIIINTWFAEQPLTALLLSFLHSKKYTGFGFPVSGKFYDASIPFEENLHVCDNLIVLTKASLPMIDKRPVSARMRYFQAENQGIDVSDKFDIRKPWVMILPFSSEPFKEWDFENWLRLLRGLISSRPEYSFIVAGTTRDSQKEATRQFSKLEGLKTVIGRTDFSDLASLIQDSSLVITVDSGSVHLCSALMKPVFVLYSAAYNFRLVLPYNTKFDFCAIDVPCARCTYGCSNPVCMNHDPQETLARVLKMLPDMKIMQGNSNSRAVTTDK